MSRSENRKRQHKVTVRFDDSEWQVLEGDCQRAGLSKPSYIRSHILNQPPLRQAKRPSIEAELLRKTLAELGKIGSNVNQLAKLSNLGQIPSEMKREEAYQAIIEIKKAILESLGKRVNPER